MYSSTSCQHFLKYQQLYISAVHTKHGRVSQRTEIQSDGEEGRTKHGDGLPPRRPVEGVVLVVARLRHQDAGAAMRRLDKVVGSHILHDLGAGIDLGVQHLLELLNGSRVEILVHGGWTFVLPEAAATQLMEGCLE